jgi:hypothetical protein
MPEPKEKEIYGQVKSEFERLLRHKFTTCYLEITAYGSFSEELKSKVKQDIVFTFIKRMRGSESRSPDITGFVKVTEHLTFPTITANLEGLITIEVKNEKISLWDVYQAKMYAELFDAKYGFLVSTDPIPTELKKLHKVHSILNRFRFDTYLGLVEFDTGTRNIVHESWFPEPPFKYNPKDLSKKAESFEESLKRTFGT